MIEGLKVPNKWGPISGSPIVNVSRVQLPWRLRLANYYCSMYTIHGIHVNSLRLYFVLQALFSHLVWIATRYTKDWAINA